MIENIISSDSKIIGKRLRELRKQRGITQVDLAAEFEISRSYLTKIETGANLPGREILIALCHYFNVSVDWMLTGTSQSINDQNSNAYLIGDIQAGAWREAIEWPESEWVPFSIPFIKKYSSFKRYALEVKGDSMNELYPPGSIVIMVNFCEIGGMPKSGDVVSVIRRDSLTDTYEATLKKVEIKPSGEVILHPCSTDPSFKKISLPHMALEYRLTNLGDSSSHPDLTIQGLVIGSVRSE